MKEEQIIRVKGKKYILESSLDSYRLNNLVVNLIILLCLFMLVFYYVSIISGADEFVCSHNGLVCEFIKYPEIPSDDIGEICFLKPDIMSSIANYENRERRGFSNEFNLI